MACDESLDEFLQGFVADSEMQSPGIPLEEPGRGQRAGVECANIASPTFPGVASKGTPAGDAQPTKRDFSRAFFEAKVKHSKVERPALPWEKGVVAEVFGTAARHSLPSFPTMVPRIEHLDPRNAEPDAGVTVGTEGHGISHGGETIFDSCISFRSAWTPASDDVSREVVCKRWLAILRSNSDATACGASVAECSSVAEQVSFIRDVFSGKATSTLRKRALSFLRYLKFCEGYLGPDQQFFRLQSRACLHIYDI